MTGCVVGGAIWPGPRQKLEQDMSALFQEEAEKKAVRKETKNLPR